MNVFGVPKTQVDLYLNILPNLDRAAQPYVDLTHVDFKSIGQKKFEDFIRHLEGNLPDIVTFNSSLVDQEAWERVSAIQLSADKDTAEVSLLYVQTLPVSLPLN